VRKIGTTLSLGACAAFAAVAPGEVLTLGDATLPSSATMGSTCGASNAIGEVVQTGTDSSFTYTVPADGGAINSWSCYTTGATADTPYELLIARPSGGNHQIVGTDSQNVPANAPAIATFTLAKPIAMEAGDVLGVVVSPNGTNTVHHRFDEGPLTGSDIVGTGFVGNGSSRPPIGSSFPIQNLTPNELVNVAANLVQGNDVGIIQQVLPATITAGTDGVLVLALTSSGPSSNPITLTDTIPSGLTIRSVSAGTGPCSVSGQNISCTLTGTPATVAIVVSAATAGAYANTAQAQGTLTDPNAANNSATATLNVTAAPVTPGPGTPGPVVQLPPAARCQVIPLGKVPLAEAKTVVRILGCAVGKVTRRAPSPFRRGDVISRPAGCMLLVSAIDRRS
jgi:hypothetical protein